MITSEKEFLQMLEVTDSLQKVILKAGGRYFGASELLHMTLWDLLSILHPNNIICLVRYNGDKN